MKLPAIRINPLGMCVLCGLVIFFIFMYTSAHYDKSSKSGSVSLKRLLAVGIAAAKAGGVKVREVRMNMDIKEQSKGDTKEGAKQLVTAGDLQSNRIMLHTLKADFPKLRVVSEEGKDDDSVDIKSLQLPLPAWDMVKKITDDIEIPADDILVWVDPLDATQEYSENLVNFVSTMVCVTVRGKPIIGIIHHPFQNTTVWAWENHGNSDLILPSDPKPDPGDSPTIIVSRSHYGNVEDVVKAAFGSAAKIVHAGGAGFKVVQVIEGKADAYVHVTDIKKWDICAGNAILHALGGYMTTKNGELINYGEPNDVLNSNGLLASLRNHNKYLEKLGAVQN